jgi:hypothetical protein
MASDLAAPALSRRVELVTRRPARHAVARLAPWALLALASVGFAWGTLGRDLGESDALLGMAATEPLGPLGQAFGGWMSALRPGRVLPSWLLARAMTLFGEHLAGWPGVVHVPALAALVALAWIVARRCGRVFGDWTGVLAGVALMSTLAWLERPTALGFDPWTGLAVVAALDRILARGSDLRAGLWAAFAVLAGGWPALALILMPVIVLGRSGSYLSWRLLVPPVLALLGWSAWCLSAAPALAWGESLLSPLKEPMAWGLPIEAALLGLPWSACAALAALPAVRRAWTDRQWRWLLGWWQVLGVATLAGTLVPGFRAPAWGPLLAASAVTAAAALSACARAEAGRIAARAAGILVAALCVIAAALGVPRLALLAAQVPAYRMTALAVLGLIVVALSFALVGAWEGRRRWVIGCVLGLAVALKLTHTFIYVVEWDYRVGQGPWGRAIGQWVPPGRPIYVTHPWPPELAFATGRPFRQIVGPAWLKHAVGPTPHYVLLQPSDFAHWPEHAPPIQKVRAFEDARGFERILARTTEPLVGVEEVASGAE